MSAAELVEVAVPVAVQGRFHYRVPAHLRGRVQVGARVLVRFAGRKLTGVVVRRETAAPPGVNPVDVSEVLDEEPALTPELVELCLWIADYYEALIGEVLRGALPAGSGVSARSVYGLTAAGERTAEGMGSALPAKLRVLIARLAEDDVPVAGASPAMKKQLEVLIGQGLVEVRDQRASARAKLKQEKVVRLVVDAQVAREATARAPKRKAIVEALLAAATSENESGGGSESENESGGGSESESRGAGGSESESGGAGGSESGGAGGSDSESGGGGESEGGSESESERGGRSESEIGNAHEMLLEELAAQIEGAKASVRELVKAKLVVVEDRERAIDAVAIGEAMHVGPPPVLTGEQDVAVRTITAALPGGSPFTPFLLHGVTGSGKTEVYLRVIAEALSAGKTALVLVPEISLTPQLAARFRARFGDFVAILHSGLSEQQRLGEWSRLRRGEARIAVGARSAVFAPIAGLGVIVVDEEHDGSFKQDEGVRYHARDVALVRAQRAGAVCVLGSGTPSLESAAHAERGTYKKLVLSERPMARPMPAVEIIDLKRHLPDDEGFLSAPLRMAIAETLGAGDQVILFLNRRGFATFVLCRACGHSFDCPNCSVSLTYYRHSDRLSCHYCAHTARVPEACPSCGADAIERKGLGTEKVAAAVAEEFPHARVARLDRDVASGPKIEAVLSRVARREVDVLVGTQMVTKGHDFPGVTLVGVLCADTGLNLPDFRASERTFQLLAQVAGRAGRGDRPGRVLIQTYRPNAPAVVAASQHDYAQFFAAEYEARKEHSYPPHGRLVLVRIDGPEEGDVAGAAQQVAAVCERATALLGAAGAETPPATVEVLGPVPAPLARLRGRSRWQVWLRSTDRHALRRVARQALTVEVSRGLRVGLDVDPISAM